MLTLYFYSWILRLFKNAKARGLDQGANQWWLPRVGAYTRAHPWDFALFAFTTFTPRRVFGGIFDEKMRSFAMLYGADISRKKRRVFQDVLKYVRKVRAMN